MGRSCWRHLLVAMFLAQIASVAEAGAWPREVGRTFISVRGEFGAESGRIRPSVYAEHGLTRRFTIGGQVDETSAHDAADAAGQPWRYRRVGAFGRLALGNLDARHRLSFSLGASAPADATGGGAATRLEAALHGGLGFASRAGPGWATATTKISLARDGARAITDHSALIGIRPSEGWMTMVSLGRYRDANGTNVKLTPSAGFEFSEELWLVGSLTRDLTHRTTGAALAIWISF